MTEPDSEASSEVVAPASKGRTRRIPRWLLLSLGVLAIVLLVRAGLPALLEWAIPWYAKKEVGIDLEIANIDLGLIGGSFAIDQLRVAHPGGAASPEPPEAPAPDPANGEPVTEAASAPPPVREDPGLLSLERLAVEIDWLELLKSHARLPVVRLDGLTLRARQNADGTLALPTPPPAEASEATSAVAAPEPAEGGAEEPADAPGWQVTVARFELNRPDLALYSAARGREVASFTATHFAVAELTSGPLGFGLGDIELEGPDLFVERDWMLDPGFPTSDEAAPATAAGPPSLRVTRLQMSSGHFQIQSPDGPIESAIRIEVSEFDTAPGHTFPVEVVLDVGEGGVSVAGALGIFPPSFEGKLVWHGLRVPPYLLLTTPAIVPWLDSCDAEGQLEVSFQSEPPAVVVLKGETHFSDLIFRHPETGELALEAARLSMYVREGRYPLDGPGPRTFDIRAIEILAPKIVFTNPPDALDELLAIFTEPPPAEEGASEGEADDEQTPTTETVAAEPAPAPEAGSAVMTLDVEKLSISDGDLSFVDRSVTPRHETHIREFRLDASGLKTAPGGVAQFEAAGRVQERGVLKVKGQLPGGNGSLRVELRRLDLPSYDGFARDAGWRLNSGDASVESSIRIRGDRYETENDLVLHDLRIDSTEPGAFSSAFGVSLDFALALLRGPEGDIQLALPVSVSKGGVGVGMGSLIRSALKEALTGILASPMKLLGGILPKGSKPSLDPIAFAPGGVEIDAAAAERIGPLVELLGKRPGIGLNLTGQTADADTESLARAMLRDGAAAGEGLPEIEGAGFFARRRLTSALRERANGEAGTLEAEDEALLARYVEAQQVPDARYEALGEARAQAVVAAFTSGGAAREALSITPAVRADEPGVGIGMRLRAAATEAEQAEEAK